jgi:tRNA A37 threonylcarbamoyladenosine biosynthesis protein TsaE
LLEQKGVVVVEWAGRVEKLLPQASRVNVKLTATEETARTIDIAASA